MQALSLHGPKLATWRQQLQSPFTPSTMQPVMSHALQATGQMLQHQALHGATRCVVRMQCAPAGVGIQTLQHQQQQQQLGEGVEIPLSSTGGPGDAAGGGLGKRRTKGSGSGDDNGSGGDDKMPLFDDGVTWYCYCVCGLLWLTDLTPLGPLLRASGPAAIYWLVGIQWLGFFAPTLAWARSQGWPVTRLLLGQRVWPGWGWLAAGAGAGAAVYLVVGSIMAAKAGIPLAEWWAGSAHVAVPPATPADPMAAFMEAERSSVLGSMIAAPSNALEAARLWACAALSPAVCEELLYRGLLLTALQRPRLAGPALLGRTDAVFVTAALFALAHLDLPQFGPLTFLGVAAGGLAVASGSVLPAIAAHATYNSAALALGVLGGGL
eukprot:CAMPEP_0202885668 /NCGR_PEP_ID=MMETSP1391-20130828/41782_1 /ASSEMBLY_ACC=CAM_ASM_000867 /TAXON_ID=1034604 /ORGANISM="Chlamydomonas leiostraca, Strain SAG 11-49" /LENGTH=379 /DNA_ID=CAMNT_0049568923 /DNA_START=301 /DNA_END=1440 /DNA_ORIENTATION=+